MLILLNWGPNGFSWFVGPVFLVLLAHAGFVPRIFPTAFSIVHSLVSQHGADSEEEVLKDESQQETLLNHFASLLKIFMAFVLFAFVVCMTLLLCKKVGQVGLHQAVVEMQVGFWRYVLQGGGRGQTAARTNRSDNPGRYTKRVQQLMSELPIEIYRSIDDLKQLSVRELKEMLRRKSIDCQHLIEKHELLRAIVESDSTSNRACSICCDDYRSDDVLRILTCKHKYHSECIEKWFTVSACSRRSPTCPYCNAAIFPDDQA